MLMLFHLELGLIRLMQMNNTGLLITKLQTALEKAVKIGVEIGENVIFTMQEVMIPPIITSQLLKDGK